MALALLFVLLIGVHLLTIAACLPMIGRRVPPNRRYGFRTPRTLANERVWYEANAIAGRLMLGATVFSGLLAALLFNRLPAVAAITTSLSVLALALVLAALASLVALRRIAE